MSAPSPKAIKAAKKVRTPRPRPTDDPPIRWDYFKNSLNTVREIGALLGIEHAFDKPRAFLKERGWSVVRVDGFGPLWGHPDIRDNPDQVHSRDHGLVEHDCPEEALARELYTGAGEWLAARGWVLGDGFSKTGVSGREWWVKIYTAGEPGRPRSARRTLLNAIRQQKESDENAARREGRVPVVVCSEILESNVCPGGLCTGKGDGSRRREHHAWGCIPVVGGKREHVLSRVVEWIAACCEHDHQPQRRRTDLSYRWKHIAEDYGTGISEYVTQGEFIVAAIRAGYPVRPAKNASANEAFVGMRLVAYTAPTPQRRGKWWSDDHREMASLVRPETLMDPAGYLIQHGWKQEETFLRGDSARRYSQWNHPTSPEPSESFTSAVRHQLMMDGRVFLLGRGWEDRAEGDLRMVDPIHQHSVSFKVALKLARFREGLIPGQAVPQ